MSDETTMKVVLKDSTPLHIASYAARVCTDTTHLEEDGIADMDLLYKIIKMGHESVLEHINYTFEIDGISRALLQELSRHRHISLSVESTRYTLKKHLKDGYVSIAYPSRISLDENPRVNIGIGRWIRQGLMMMMDMYEDGFPTDIVKYLLPECVCTRLIMTCNLRELRHIYRLRSSERALPEFRALVKEIKDSLPVMSQALLMAGMDE